MNTDLKKLPKASTEKIDEYYIKAKEFINSNYYYSSASSVAICAVVEFMAYQDGYTIRDWN